MTITKMKKPRIKIIGYERDLEEEEVENFLREQNKYIEQNDELKIKFIKKKTNHPSSKSAAQICFTSL